MPLQASVTRSITVPVVLALGLMLSACSGNSGSSTSASSAKATASSSTATNSSPSTTTSTAADASKPSKKAAASGLAKILKEGPMGPSLTAAQLATVATCVVDKTYDTLTAKTLRAMATGDSKTDPDSSDQPALTAAVAYCGKASGVTPPSPTTSS
ncbi:MAG: hypothetical protein M3Y49_04275 [Actinomycetota bacterium]|nr:hypothetical protein [Actinomycetota bacterium]